MAGIRVVLLRYQTFNGHARRNRTGIGIKIANKQIRRQTEPLTVDIAPVAGDDKITRAASPAQDRRRRPEIMIQRFSIKCSYFLFCTRLRAFSSISNKLSVKLTPAAMPSTNALTR